MPPSGTSSSAQGNRRWDRARHVRPYGLLWVTTPGRRPVGLYLLPDLGNTPGRHLDAEGMPR